MNTYEVYLFNGNRTLTVTAAGFAICGEYAVFTDDNGENVACFHNATSVVKHGAAQ